MVSIETVAPLQDIPSAECVHSTVEFYSCIRKHITVCHWNFGSLTVQNITPLISLQNLGLHAGTCVQEAKHDLAQLKH